MFKFQSRLWGICLLLSMLLLAKAQLMPQRSQAQTESLIPSLEATSTEESSFFADVLVRGQPILQVGSLSNLSAAERAKIINRRIAGLLSQSQSLDPVTVQYNTEHNIASLRVKNRVLMTITQQDALDFNTKVEDLAKQWADILNSTLTQPNLAVDVIQRLDGTARQLVRSAINNLPSFMGAVLVVFVTWAVAKGVRKLARVWAEQTEGDRNTEILIAQICYGGVWVLGSIVALGVLGLDFGVLLGTLGLTSVAIGFGLKDVLSNYLSGVILLAARPFRINDQVVIEEYEGTIIQIQLRATTIQTYDGRFVYIPNQDVFQSSIINNTASTVRRSSITVGIDYDADVSKAKQAIADAVINLEGVESDPPPIVLVRELAASTVNLEVRFWVNSRRQSFLQVTSAATQVIKEKLQQENIEMPTDIYTLVFRNQLTTPESRETNSQSASDS
ncbi:mechanosensitive ion channel family protein [Anabaena cylindrica UHCC 0172]|uniref:mechanosensitive ion channel family protein n=1 Tax=Anabaena cylindrica TaxID=1165 RepID=UPI002B20D288|nr:mechanosensitive ion channel family protein [Anabaena cylindrica]MEA5550434.1 mechanosensitive ion channel family protein [Anabaena cylindrica UHCC 0172]